MTGKEIATLALRGEPTPRPAVTLVAGGEWFFTQAGRPFAEALADPALLAQVFVRGFELAGHDLMWVGAGLLNYPAHALGCPLVEEGTATPALRGTAINALAERDRLDFAAGLAHPAMRAILAAHRLVADHIGDRCCLLPTQWGPFTLAGRLLGAEATMLASVRAPRELAELIRDCAEFIWAQAEEYLAHPLVAGINLSEPLASPDLISPRAFDLLVRPVLAELFARTKALGKLTMLHVCGNATPLLGRVAELGPDSFSLEAKVDLAAAREVLAGKVCVVGNLSPSGVFLTGTPEEVRAAGLACLAAWGEVPGFILSVGCDFPRTVPLANVRAFMSCREARRA